MAVLYSLYYGFTRRKPYWWAGIAFVLLYATVLIWQTYWAIATARKTAWGTRSGRADDGLGFRIIGTIGSPQPSGIPVCDEVEHIGAVAAGELGGRVIERKLPFNLVGGTLAWVVGIIAIPLTAVPFVAYAHYSQEGRLIALHVDRAVPRPGLREARRAPTRATSQATTCTTATPCSSLNVHAVMDGDSSEGDNPESSRAARQAVRAPTCRCCATPATTRSRPSRSRPGAPACSTSRTTRCC